MPPLQNYVRGVHDLTDLPDGVRKLRAGFGRLSASSMRVWSKSSVQCHRIGACRRRKRPPFSEEFPFNLPAGARAKFEHNSDEYIAIKEFVERTSRASSYKSVPLKKMGG